MDTAVTESKILIHANFAPDGTCIVIEEQPAWAANAHDWFKHLSRNTVNSYRPLQGGRGLFSISKALLMELQNQP